MSVALEGHHVRAISNPLHPLDSQHVIVTFNYDGPVPNGINASNFQITIGGVNITTPTYDRPLNVTTPGNDLILNIGPVVVPPGPFTAQFSGLINIVGTFSSSEIDDIDFRTIIPLGVTASGFVADPDSTSMTIESQPHVRGILNVGIYKEVGDPATLVPIDPDLNTKIAALGNPTFINGINAYIVHFPDFNYFNNTAEVAHRIANILTTGSANTVPILAGYAITAVGSTVTVEKVVPTDEVLHIYIFDDNLIQALPTDDDYDSIAGATPPGTLPEIPELE